MAEEKIVTPLEELKAAADEATNEYAIVEIYGHRRHAGRILEVEKFGAKMLRIDIPKDGDFEAGYTTMFYGGGSVFSMSPCDLETVKRANKSYMPAATLTHHEDDEGESGDEF